MKFAHITIHTDKQAEEVEFYKTYAGLDVTRAFGNIIFVGNGEPGETQIEIIQDAEAVYDGRNLSIGFGVKDVVSYREKLAAAGLNPTPMTSPNPSVSFFFVTDPAGLTVQFIEE